MRGAVVRPGHIVGHVRDARGAQGAPLSRSRCRAGWWRACLARLSPRARRTLVRFRRQRGWRLCGGWEAGIATRSLCPKTCRYGFIRSAWVKGRGERPRLYQNHRHRSGVGRRDRRAGGRPGRRRSYDRRRSRLVRSLWLDRGAGPCSVPFHRSTSQTRASSDILTPTASKERGRSAAPSRGFHRPAGARAFFRAAGAIARRHSIVAAFS